MELSKSRESILSEEGGGFGSLSYSLYYHPPSLRLSTYFTMLKYYPPSTYCLVLFRLVLSGLIAGLVQSSLVWMSSFGTKIVSGYNSKIRPGLVWLGWTKKDLSKVL